VDYIFLTSGNLQWRHQKCIFRFKKARISSPIQQITKFYLGGSCSMVVLITNLSIRSRWGSRPNCFTTWEKSTESIWQATVWDPETVWTTWRRQKALSWWESNYDSADFDGYLESNSKCAYLMKPALTEIIHGIKTGWWSIEFDSIQQKATVK